MQTTPFYFAIFSSVLHVPLAFSPCPHTNGEIDLLAIGLSECLPSRLPRENRMWMGGIKRVPNDEGLLDNCLSQALAAYKQDFLFDFP